MSSGRREASTQSYRYRYRYLISAMIDDGIRNVVGPTLGLMHRINDRMKKPVTTQ
jgi:hypothetical protein